ncbi:ABC transporter permease subunit, partial [Mesorhizobium metallidurans]|uniref:ABC transporter permease subunit n=1 Tax=Mesorhizobium metallidurans TaxID=489722 RepID=UPI001FCBE844
LTPGDPAVAAWQSGGVIDRILTVFATLGFSVPVFVVGFFLIYLFAIISHWLPVQGYRPIDHGFGPWLVHLILPTVALSLGYIAFIARIARTAAAKGASSYAMLFPPRFSPQ